MKAIVVIIAILFSFTACAQQDTSYLSNWKSHPIPTSRDFIDKLGYSLTDWMVYKSGDTLKVTSERSFTNHPTLLPFRVHPSKRERYELSGLPLVMPVDDGYLAGYYHGEFGGALYWFSKNGKSHYKIADAHVRQLFKRDGHIYIIEGLAHLSMSVGSILSVEKYQGKWTAKEYLKLPTAPEAAIQDTSNGNFIIMTSKSLLTVDRQAHINMLVERGMWYDSLYPNSIVLQGPMLYVGMRAGVYQYNFTTGEQRWLQPK